MKKRIIILLLSLVLVLVAVGMVASVAVAGSVIGHIGDLSKTATTDQTFAVTGAPTISVQDHNGTITVTRGTENSVVVHATKRAATDGLLAKLQVNIQQDGNRITIGTTGDTSSGFAWFGNHGMAVDYQIEAPAHADLGPITSSNGRIDVTGIAGQFDLSTSNGIITARDVDGNVSAQTDNGRVSVIGGRGMLRLGSSNGIVEVQNVEATGLDLHTSNGRVSFTGSLALGSKNTVETSNGTVSIILPPESALSVDLRSGNGSVHVNGFPVTTSGENKRNVVQGVINRSDADLTVHTGNGSITLARQGI
ncbi:MAG: DUF4097 domain-containing protein [Chloroflexota bacterium]|nr:DUF4097 domain-containing protein [Chloroflexota bacterium]